MSKNKISIGDIKGTVMGVGVSGKGHSFVHNEDKSVTTIKIKKKTLKNLPEEYASALSDFQKNLNREIEQERIAGEGAAELQQEVDALVEEAASVPATVLAETDHPLPDEKKTGLRNRLRSIGAALKRHLPSAAEAAAAMTPLAPFSKIIGESVGDLLKSDSGA
jgi:hypothetical protein